MARVGSLKSRKPNRSPPADVQYELFADDYDVSGTTLVTDIPAALLFSIPNIFSKLNTLRASNYDLFLDVLLRSGVTEEDIHSICTVINDVNRRKLSKLHMCMASLHV